jgi:hypothetical protein
MDGNVSCRVDISNDKLLDVIRREIQKAAIKNKATLRLLLVVQNLHTDDEEEEGDDDDDRLMNSRFVIMCFEIVTIVVTNIILL